MLKKTKEKKIKDIKNHTAEAVEKVHIWTFAAFEIIVYIGLDRIVFGRILPNSVWAEILRAVIFAFAYAILYRCIKFIFEKIKQGKLPIEGKWYHVHIPNTELLGIQTKKETLSAGTTRVSRNLNDFTFLSNNYKYTVDYTNNPEGNVVVVTNNGTLCTEDRINDEIFYTYDRNGKRNLYHLDPCTTWYTETSEICDGNDIDLVEVYKAQSTRKQTIAIQQCPTCGSEYAEPRSITEATEDRYGIHKYKLSSRDEREMICTYSDCWPSLKSGKLYLYRDRNARDNKIKEFFMDNSNQQNT